MTITWDDRGVPTIEADSELGVSHGFGYAQAVAHAGAVLQNYGIARGRAAALWGPDFLAGDVEHAQLGLDAALEQWFGAQQEPTLQRLRAFCEGFNAACAEDPRLGEGRREALPVTPRDVVAQTVALHLTFARIWDTGLAFAPAARAVSAGGGGSNAWAVAADRSSTGEAMLLINPHIPWVGPFRLFEARSISPGRSCHGITTVGLPWQVMGYGPDTAWVHTVNPIPLLWVYQLDVADGHYRHGGEQLPLQQREHTVEVRGEPARTVVERRSVHGPVLTAPDGATVAVRIAGVLQEPATGALEAWWQMSQAASVGELLQIQDRQPLPLFNVLTTDRHGSVAAAFCGATPHRPGGAFEDSQRRLAGDDPAELWQQLNPPTSLPRVVDPRCGWVQSVNDPPWFFSEPVLDPADHPDGISLPPSTLHDIRSPFSRAWLDVPGAISAEHLLELKWRTHVPMADLVLPDLLAAAETEADLAEAVAVLRDWDRRADVGSRGYVLFLHWAQDHLPMATLALDGSRLVPAAEPGGAPTGLSDPAGAVQSLRRAVEVLVAAGHPLDVGYGEFATITPDVTAPDVTAPDGPPVPASGGSTDLGITKCLDVVPTGEGAQGIGGDTWIALVRYTADGPQASALLTSGNTSEPSAPAHDSQLPDFVAGHLRALPPLPSQPRGLG